jgi:Ca-activated chloride channel homolog
MPPPESTPQQSAADNAPVVGKTSTSALWAYALCALIAVALMFHARARAFTYAEGSAAPPQASEQDEFSLKVDVSMVLVEATVQDSKGRNVDNLKPEDFHVFEDGVEQRISYFSRDELPLAVALVVDASGSIAPVLPQLHSAAFDTLSQLKPEDQVALYAFATHPERIVDLTTNRRSIADGIMGIGSTGGTNIADALFASIEYLGQEARDRRHAVIMISDNQPTAKGDYDGDDVIRLALETQTIVYSVRLGDDRMGHTPDEPDWIPGARWVNKIMIETGGEIIDVAAEGSAQKAMAAVIARLKQRYTLGYESSNTRRENAFRKIDVRLSDHAEDPKHPFRVFARHGYYPAPEAAPPNSR